MPPVVPAESPPVVAPWRPPSVPEVAGAEADGFDAALSDSFEPESLPQALRDSAAMRAAVAAAVMRRLVRMVDRAPRWSVRE